MTTSLAGKKAWILGADPSAEAAAELARRRGAACRQFSGEETLDTSETLPDVAVVSAGFGRTPPLARALQERGVNVIGERELAFQESLCLHVAIAGANGKSTTAELVAHVLRESGRRVAVACGPEHPASAFVEMTRDLDLMVHGVEAGELEHLKFFRPVVAVLLNAPLDGAEENDGGGGERAAAPARNWGLYGPLFASQQAFDWAIVQSEALALFQAAGARLPGKVITFSAFSRQADLGYDRGLLVSRLEAWSGRLWDTGNGRMRGPHLAENALAALAVGRVLRISLDEMRHALESFEPGPGRFETIGEAEGVRFIDDGRSANSDALAKALLALAPAPPERPFIWLVAGGAAPGRQFYDLGPLLSPRVKHAAVFGEAAAAMRAAWSLFTPCTLAGSLSEAASLAVSQATAGDIVLFSPGCPRSGRAGGAEAEIFRRTVWGRFPELAEENRKFSAPGGGASLSSLAPLSHAVAEGP